MQIMINLTSLLETIYQVSAAGVAITAVALLMYATSFNFRDRIVQTFGLILACVVLIYANETIASISNTPDLVEFCLRVKWIGLVMLPAIYLHFSDALLTLTGRPSRGRRKTILLIIYILSFFVAVLVPLGVTVGGLASAEAPMPYLERNDLTFAFGIFYILVMLMASYNLVRAVLRSITRTSRRRLIYLLAGAAAPAVTSVIFLFHGNLTFARHPDWFWLISIVGALLTGVFLVIMTYVVSFFGLRWTDRAIKSRLLRWLLRGPLVAAVVLTLTTMLRRYGESLGDPYIASVPVVMVVTILVLEYLVTIASPYLEKRLFYGEDRGDLELIQGLQDRMLTRKDLNQFLETIAASICDRLQVAGCFIAVLEGDEVDYIIHAGDRHVLDKVPIAEQLISLARENVDAERGLLEWGHLYLIPLEYRNGDGMPRLLGLCGLQKDPAMDLEDEDLESITMLAERATLALKDRALQTQVIRSISDIQSEVDYIQNLRASTSYDRQILLKSEAPEISPEMVDWVKGALTHYWGGPKLTNNPLLNLKVVEAASQGLDGNRTNALRSVLKSAIERTRPEGERRFTSDWILYNILELKFVQGKKVREVANKLAVSEADLYRKQRVALERIATIISGMEQDQYGLSQSEDSPSSKPEENPEA